MKGYSRGNSPNDPIGTLEVKFLVRTFPQEQIQGQTASLVNSDKHLRKKQYPFCTNFPQKFKRGDYFSTHVMRPALP